MLAITVLCADGVNVLEAGFHQSAR